jgi:SAM-dependent methyltransferase
MAEHRCKICGASPLLFLKDIFDDRHGYPGQFDIYRCNTCGFGQTVPEIDEDIIGEIYTKYYPRKNIISLETLQNHPVKISPFLKRWWMGVNNTAHYHIKKGTKVLDIGCGDCTSIREINAMGSEGYGIEPDQNIRSVVDTLGLKVHVGLFHEIPYSDKYFDYITMSQVLEHIHNPIELLTSFRRILKDDGQVIIGVPNIDSRLRKKYRHRWLNWHVPYHLNHFSRGSLVILANRSGYTIKKIKTYTPNLWIDLQKRLFYYPIQEGKKVPFFNAETEPESERPSKERGKGIHYFFNKYFLENHRFLRYFQLMNIPVLRINDALDRGESYLVFMEKGK